VYKGIKNLTLRTTFSTGFRAPQVFDEDLHITQVGGEGTLIVNNDNLKEEKSMSLTVGLDYGKQIVNKLYQFSISGFFHRLNNAFTLGEIDPLPNARVFERFNSDGVKIYGVELEAGFQIYERLELFTGWTFQKSQLDTPEPDFNSDQLFRSPNVYGNMRVEWKIPKIVDFRVELNYTGSMKVPHFAGYIDEDRLEESDPFFVLNVNFTKDIEVFKGHKVTLVAGIYNLLDEYQDDLDVGIVRDAGYVYGPRFPRTFRMGFKYNF
jgi:outer membrane receptor for ferrienterochelin and colicins